MTTKTAEHFGVNRGQEEDGNDMEMASTRVWTEAEISDNLLGRSYDHSLPPPVEGEPACSVVDDGIIERDEEGNLPCRLLSQWYLVRQPTSPLKHENKLLFQYGTRMPLPTTGLFASHDVLFGWLLPNNNTMDNDDEDEEEEDPIFVRLDPLDRWIMDRSKHQRGYWVRTQQAAYWLQDPCCYLPQIQPQMIVESSTSTSNTGGEENGNANSPFKRRKLFFFPSKFPQRRQACKLLKDCKGPNNNLQQTKTTTTAAAVSNKNQQYSTANKSCCHLESQRDVHAEDTERLELLSHLMDVFADLNETEVEMVSKMPPRDFFSWYQKEHYVDSRTILTWDRLKQHATFLGEHLVFYRPPFTVFCPLLFGLLQDKQPFENDNNGTSTKEVDGCNNSNKQLRTQNTEEPCKRKRGRPRKNEQTESNSAAVQPHEEKKKRGRPRKNKQLPTDPAAKRPRGRPRKNGQHSSDSTAKRPRGRPRKIEQPSSDPAAKRPRGRPRKNSPTDQVPKEKRKRGRPRKNSQEHGPNVTLKSADAMEVGSQHQPQIASNANPVDTIEVGPQHQPQIASNAKAADTIEVGPKPQPQVASVAEVAATIELGPQPQSQTASVAEVADTIEVGPEPQPQVVSDAKVDESEVTIEFGVKLQESERGIVRNAEESSLGTLSSFKSTEAGETDTDHHNDSIAYMSSDDDDDASITTVAVDSSEAKSSKPKQVHQYGAKHPQRIGGPKSDDPQSEADHRSDEDGDNDDDDCLSVGDQSVKSILRAPGSTRKNTGGIRWSFDYEEATTRNANGDNGEGAEPSSAKEKASGSSELSPIVFEDSDSTGTQASTGSNEIKVTTFIFRRKRRTVKIRGRDLSQTMRELFSRAEAAPGADKVFKWTDEEQRSLQRGKQSIHVKIGIMTFTKEHFVTLTAQDVVDIVPLPAQNSVAASASSASFVQPSEVVLELSIA